MTEQQGMNSNVSVGKRNLHVQTAYSRSGAKIISTIFEDGRVIETRDEPVHGKVTDSELKQRVEAVHRKTVEDLELLFFIADKVRQVKHAVSCNKLGLVFLQRGFYREAIEFFQLALKADPKLADVFNNLGRALLHDGQLDRAEEFLKKGLEIEDGYADLHLNMGVVYYRRNDFPQALRHLTRALEINPSYFDAHFYLGQTYLRSYLAELDHEGFPPLASRPKRALEHYERAAKLYRPMANDAFAQAKTAVEAEDYESAVKYFDKAYLEASARMDFTFDHEFYLKFMYGGKGKDNQFIGGYVEQLQAALRDYPEYPDLHNNLGIAYLIMCRNLFLKALDEFRQALRINPNFKKAEKNLKLAENDGKGFLILLRALLK